MLASRRHREAEALLREAIDLIPGSAEAHNDLGVALASTNRVAEAAGHFRRAVELDPKFAEARDNLDAARQSSR